MITGLGAALEPITRVRGVRGAMIVSATEGILVAEAVMEGVNAQAVAALAAGLAARLRRATDAAGRGAPVFIHLEAEAGAILAVPGERDLLVVAVTQADVNVGLVRLELRRAADRLA